jgi:agmatinase
MDFSLLGICLDRKSFRRGAHKAPFEIKNVFQQLETYVNGIDLHDVFLRDLGYIEPNEYDDITVFLKKNLKGGFPVFIGGDHSVSFPLVNFVKPKVFVSFDAHPDCEDRDLCYFSVTRKIAENGFKSYLYGSRCVSKAEEEYIKTGKVKIATLEDLRKINEPTYLSIDFDVLDSSVMPAVAVPEPNGLAFNQVVEAVRALSKNLVAVDFVEFLPSENVTYTLIAAKLIYSALAEIIKARTMQ